MQEDTAQQNSEHAKDDTKRPANTPFYKNKYILLLIGIGIILITGVGIKVLSKQTKIQTANQNPTYQSNTNNTNLQPTEEKKNMCPTDYGMIEVLHESAAGAFKAAITDTNNLRLISSGKLVGDARFTYLWLKNGQKTPIYAPADGVLIQIFYKNRSDLSSSLSKPDYDVVFLVDCHTMYRINHITDPVVNIKDQSPISQPMELKPGSGYNDRDTLPKNHITVKAGQQIGTTTGTAGAHNFDFGVFVDKQAVCPYDQFPDPIRSDFLSLLGNASNPIKGTPCDVSGMY